MTESPAETPQTAPAWYERGLLWLVATLPVAITIWRLSGGAQWRGDLPAVRDQGLVAIHFGGTVSTAAVQLLGLLPLGSMPFRAALAAALALGVAAVLVHRIARTLLARVVTLSAPLAAVLAAIAALMAALSPAWQREATVAGGATIALMLVLLAIDQALTIAELPALAPAATRRWLVLAATVGLTTAESVPAGLAAATAASALTATAGRLPRLRLVPWAIGLSLLVVAIGSAGLLLRPLSPGSWSDVGRALSMASLETLQVDAVRKTTLLAWLDEVGALTLALAAIGLVRGAFRERTRAIVAALVAVLLCDLVYPSSAATALLPEPLAALRCASMMVFATGASAGVAEIVTFLMSLAIPMARPAAVLTVAFHVTLAAVTSEDAAFAADRSDHVAAEEWTDEALERLPRDAALLVHAPELAWRLWAAQMIRGQRPDVLVIPVPMLRHGRVTSNLLPSEPAVAQLLRDLALTGQASEYGLSLLADARPLLVELDPRWDRRIVTHLTIEGPWLRYEPQVLGRSDRKIAAHVLVSGRVLAGIREAVAEDRPSATVVAKTLKEHVATLSLLGMGDTARPWLDGVEKLDPKDPFVVPARLRIAYAVDHRRSRRSVELRDLLAF
ncbi:MAG TPA: hypothetical protein ENK57_10320 [Polyangiaceae bacterium]|nr:hypothetical protein [Polyangiaceae bacterium]